MKDATEYLAIVVIAFAAGYWLQHSRLGGWQNTKRGQLSRNIGATKTRENASSNPSAAGAFFASNLNPSRRFNRERQAHHRKPVHL